MKNKNKNLDWRTNDPTSVRNGGTDLSGLSEAELYQFSNLVSPEEKREMAEEARRWIAKNPNIVEKYKEKYGIDLSIYLYPGS